MNKADFLDRLREKLSALPKDELEERIGFYSEMIDDRTEEGCSEEEAVADIGTADSVAAAVMADAKILDVRRGEEKKANAELKAEHKAEHKTEHKAEHKRQKTIPRWVIILLALGSPVWLSLLVAAISVAVSAYVVLWTSVITLCAVFGSFAACSAAFVAAGVSFFARAELCIGVAFIGAALIMAGLAVFLFFGCRAAAKGAAQLTGRSFLLIKSCIVKTEGVQ